MAGLWVFEEHYLNRLGWDKRLQHLASSDGCLLRLYCSSYSWKSLKRTVNNDQSLNCTTGMD